MGGGTYSDFEARLSMENKMTAVLTIVFLSIQFPRCMAVLSWWSDLSG